ncbi:MAG: hypothetical protein NZM94_11135 [Roseiflexus sp.]|nr:hypothetical protein [Roseiflexus sp.]
MPVGALLVTEVNAPEDVPPLGWLLLTTLAAADAATAWELVCWSGYRWVIARYHSVLTSGGQVEQVHLERRPQLERALVASCSVAWRLLWLTSAARARPDQPWTAALDDNEWQALAGARTNRAAPPAEPPRWRAAVRWMAQLGGFLARTGAGEPGVQTLCQGTQCLHDLTLMWRSTRFPPALRLTCG